MPRQKGDILYVLKAKKPVALEVAYEFVPAKTLDLPESFFRDAIAEEPELVIGPCRTGADKGMELVDEDEEWRFWSKEFPVESAGKADVLLLSNLGRIGIVEAKLASNPEKRREVLAQILDYATHFPRSLTGLRLPPIPKDKDFNVDPEEVEQHLQDGDFLLIIAGDELEDRMIRLSESLLGKHMANPWNLALVDICPYRAKGATCNSEILLVPAFRKAVVAAARNVVRITASGVKIEQIPPPTPGRPPSITPDKFFTVMAKESPSAAPKVQELVDKLDKRLKQGGTKSAITYEFRNGRVLRIKTNGIVVVNDELLRGQLGKRMKNVDGIVSRLIKTIRTAGFKQTAKDYRCSVTSATFSMQGLLDAVKEFLDVLDNQITKEEGA